MRDSLALACVLGAVTSVEETSADGDKRIIVFTGVCQCCLYSLREHIIPLQHSIAMAVDDRNRIGVCDTDMVWLYPDHRSILLVCIVDSQVTFALTSLEEEPEVCESRREG